MINPKIKRKLKKLLKQVTPSIETVNKHFYPFIHTCLLVHIIIRVEQLHTLVSDASDVIVTAVFSLMIKTQQASYQFEAAIRSILSLFGGDPA